MTHPLSERAVSEDSAPSSQSPPDGASAPMTQVAAQETEVEAPAAPPQSPPDGASAPMTQVAAQETEVEAPTAPLADPALAPDVEQEPKQTRRRIPYVSEGVEARVELYQSHALTQVETLLRSFDEGFIHVFFDRDDGEDVLCDEYENADFHVTYRMREHKRDELRVRWVGKKSSRIHCDAELLALARQLAYMLGGGTNLRLVS
ncbi:MAG: hypothetical protein MI924_14890 [Chloroflexales bacterium]|nr:hypothetical protein [Chloroflexales bacterium]